MGMSVTGPATITITFRDGSVSYVIVDSEEKVWVYDDNAIDINVSYD